MPGSVNYVTMIAAYEVMNRLYTVEGVIVDIGIEDLLMIRHRVLSINGAK